MDIPYISSLAGIGYVPFFVVLFLFLLSIAFLLYQQRKIKRFQELQSSSDLLQYVIEHSRFAIAIHDTRLHYLYVSKKYCEEYHIPDGNAIIGKHHYEVIPSLPKKWRIVHQRCLRGEVLTGEDDSYVHEDGSVDYTRWECRPWYTKEGAIGGIIVYTELLTEQKRMASELKEAHDFLEALLASANSPIVVWNASFTITRANHCFASLVGLAIPQIIGKQVGDVFSSLGEGELDRLEHRLNTEHALSNVEIHLSTREGKIRTILWNAGSIFDPIDGSVVATIAQGLDITERTEIEQQNREQLEELKRWYEVMSHREGRVIELKREVNALLKEMDKTIRYPSVEEEANV